MTSGQKQDISKLLDSYEKTFRDLERYDEDSLDATNDMQEEAVPLSLQEVQVVVSKLKNNAKKHIYFGNEKQEGVFKAILEGIHQSFAGSYIYPSIADKAVNLLYLIIKNHPFVDGNKRIGAAMFLLFLDKNDRLKEAKLDVDKLSALSLLIAESPPSQKDNIINFVIRAVFLTHSRS